MAHLTRTRTRAEAETADLWAPRDDVVVEGEAGEGRFLATVGPFRSYE